MVDAVHRFVLARHELKFHEEMAMQRGDLADFRAWRELIAEQEDLDLLYGKIVADLQAMEAAGDTMLWRRPPPATAQQPPVPSPGPSAAASLPQQGHDACSMPSGALTASLARAVKASPGAGLPVPKWSPTAMEIDMAVADHPEFFTTSETGEVFGVDQPMSMIAAFLMDAEPGELPTGKPVGQLRAGSPSSLACSGCLTAPQPSFMPFDIQGCHPAHADPNLIVWDPDENATKWIHPDLHLCPSVLVKLAAIYPTTDVLVETDRDERGVAYDDRRTVSAEQHALAKLNANSLPPFALAGTIDIMMKGLLQDLEWKKHREGGTEDRTQPGATCPIWSRRLVYRRHINQASLMGCVQICRQRTLQTCASITSLLRKLRPKCAGPSYTCAEAGRDQPRMHQADSNAAAADGQVMMVCTDSGIPPPGGHCYLQLPGGQNLGQYARCPSADLPPEQAARICQALSERDRRAQDQKAKSLHPAEDQDEDYKIEHAAEEEAEAAQEGRQVFAEAKEEARRAAQKADAERAQGLAEARTHQLEKQADDIANKLLL